MDRYVEIRRYGDSGYRVQLHVGNQYFWVNDAMDELDAAEFTRDMLIKALETIAADAPAL